MLQKKFEESYQTLSEAVRINPDESYLLYNRGLSARFTSRMGQSLRDFEQAAVMKQDSVISGKIEEQLKVAREIALSEMKLRGQDFTLEQLIEQQEWFQLGNNFRGRESGKKPGLHFANPLKWEIACRRPGETWELAFLCKTASMRRKMPTGTP